VGASEVRYKAGAGEVRAEVVWREARFCIEGAMHPNGRQCESDHVFRAIESDFGGIGISELHGKKRDEFR